MARIRRKMLLGCLGVAVLAGVWALHVELTFEHNVRRGIPADFRLHPTRPVVTWHV